jgi:hypothetical protein
MSLETAERWCDALELEATGRGLPQDGAFWTLGGQLIAAERAAQTAGLVSAPVKSRSPVNIEEMPCGTEREPWPSECR